MGHTYDWSSDAMTLQDSTREDQSGLVAGTYELMITDDIGCTLDTSFTLRQPNAIGIDTIIPKYSDFAIACADSSTGQITVIPFGGADSSRNTYTWVMQGGGQLAGSDSALTGLSAGIYRLTVTDINGCDSSWTFTMNEPLPIVFENLSDDSAKCADTPTGLLRVDVSGGVPGYTYLWSGDDSTYTTQDPVGVYAGFYTLVVTDANFCVKTDTISVYEADLFDVEMFVLTDYHGSPISCAGASDAELYIESIGGTFPYHYLWNTGATDQGLVDIPAGNYKVVVHDVYGCTDSADVLITEPPPLMFNMQSEDPLCYGDSNGRIESVDFRGNG